MANPSEHEKLVEKYLQENNKEAAIQLLVELIVKTARERQFTRAESLRDKLFEVDPLAVNAIVKTGEIIEAEKRAAIDQDHLNTWRELYASLTPVETNTLYYGMEPMEYPAGHMIFKQGDICSRLFFIDAGRAKMFYRQADKAVLLKSLGPGDLAGEDTFFFSDAFCTTSLITDSRVKCRVVPKDKLQKLNETSPGLEPKINDYCMKLESVCDLLKAKKLERRIQKRLDIPGTVMVQNIDDHGKPVEKPYRGGLLDLSASGLGFIIKTTARSATLLLGRQLDLQLTFAELSSKKKIRRIATVVAVNREPFNEYGIHAEFVRSLNQTTLDDLEALMDSRQA